MAELADTPKRSQLLAQLKRVCHLQHAISKSLGHHPKAMHRIRYEDAASQTHWIEIDAQFTAGLSKIRRTLIAECHDQGFVDEMAYIFQRIDG